MERLRSHDDGQILVQGEKGRILVQMLRCDGSETNQDINQYTFVGSSNKHCP